MEKYNVFLGGTCAESTWREQLMPMLDKFNITYFNPVVDDWTEDCQVIENWHKENDDYNLFVITKEMQGCFSIAEVVDLSNKKPSQTLFCVLYDGMEKFQVKSLKATVELVQKNGGIVLNNLEEIADYLNGKINETTNDDMFEYKNILEIKPDSKEQNIPSNFYYVPKIFLAGTIDMGNSVDWQTYLCKVLDEYNKKCVIFNPRRNTWPDNNSDEFSYQVNWELDHLEESDIIVMNILGTSKSPITLMELGLFARTKKLVVICEKDFYRYSNVEITCDRYAVPLYNNLEEYLTNNIK